MVSIAMVSVVNVIVSNAQVRTSRVVWPEEGMVDDWRSNHCYRLWRGPKVCPMCKRRVVRVVSPWGALVSDHPHSTAVWSQGTLEQTTLGSSWTCLGYLISTLQTRDASAPRPLSAGLVTMRAPYPSPPRLACENRNNSFFWACVNRQRQQFVYQAALNSSKTATLER